MFQTTNQYPNFVPGNLQKHPSESCKIQENFCHIQRTLGGGRSMRRPNSTLPAWGGEGGAPNTAEAGDMALLWALTNKNGDLMEVHQQK